MSIGERIKARRLELGMTQSELAKKLGYTDRASVSRVEAGQINLPQSRIVQFAEALRVSPSYIMGWENEDKKNPVTEDGMSENRRKAMRIVAKVSEDKVEFFLKLMEAVLDSDA